MFQSSNTFRIPLFVLFAHFALTGGAQTIIDSSYANNMYKHRVALFRAMPDTKNEIIFLGNSLTEAGEWQELFPGKNVKNRGISGDVTYGILARMDEVLASKPGKIFLLTGTNDLKRGIPADTIVKVFERIIWQVKQHSPKTILYIQSVFPVHEKMTGPSYKKITNRLVLQLNEKLKSLARHYQLDYIDLHSFLTDEEGGLKKELTHDGIHLWPDAYILWADYLKQHNYL